MNHPLVTARMALVTFALTALALMTLALHPRAEARLSPFSEDCIDASFSKLTSLAKDTSDAIERTNPNRAGKRPPLIRVAGQYGPNETRKIIDNVWQYPYSAIGFVGQNCSAFRISECHILSAAHCVYSPNGEPTPRSEVFITSATMENARRNRATTIAGEGPIKWSSYKGDHRANQTLDWQVGRLPGRTGKTTGFFGLTSETPSQSRRLTQGALYIGDSEGRCEDRTKAHVSGYSGDLREPGVMVPPLSSDSTLEVIRHYREDSLVGFRATTFAGSSGGPIWRCADDGTATVIGINTRSHYDSNTMTQTIFKADEDVNLASGVTIASISPEIDRFIRENPCDPETASASPAAGAGVGAGAGVTPAAPSTTEPGALSPRPRPGRN